MDKWNKKQIVKKPRCSNALSELAMEANDETIEALLRTENDLVLNAEETHGEYFSHAVRMCTLLNNIAHTISRPERFLFIAFLSHVKKHLVLALFSCVRRHHVQAGMDLRQVLEASTWAAYALAHHDLDLFRVVDQNGRLEVPDRLANARYRWLTDNYPEKSQEIKNLKDLINKSVAHASITQVFQTFEARDEGNPGFITSFFDQEDEFQIKMDLLLVANTAMGMIQLFSVVNIQENVFRFPQDFVQIFRDLSAEHETLRNEIRTHERFREFTE